VLGSDSTAIEIRGLVRSFGAKTALAGIDLTVRVGEIHALLGPNGAGKTTLTRILCGLTDPDRGKVEVAGEVGFVPSGDRTFYLRISGLENLIFFGRLQGLRLAEARRRAVSALADVGLSEAAKLPAGRYSHGMQKRLSIARALIADPAVLIVDEATHDLDPEGASRIRSLVRCLAERGAAVLWTTQRVEEIRGFAQAVTFLQRGEVRFAGSVDDFVACAPYQRYLVTVRKGDLRSADATKLQRALGSAAEILDGPGSGTFVMSPSHGSALGAAIARLSAAGFEVTACAPQGGEIEEAFLALSAGGCL
jgi:ABC-type multidrug transport system ATPase subunit